MSEDASLPMPAPLPEPASLPVMRQALAEVEELSAKGASLWWLLRRLAAAQTSVEEARAVQDLRELVRHALTQGESCR